MAAVDEASRPFAGLSDVSISEDIPVEGDISVPVSSSRRDDEFSTLDEPVKETILRDLRAVGNKFIHVLYPKRSSALLRDWDLWGPLLLCVTLALLLQGGAADSDDQGGPQFAEVLHLVLFCLQITYITYLSHMAWMVCRWADCRYELDSIRLKRKVFFRCLRHV